MSFAMLAYSIGSILGWIEALGFTLRLAIAGSALPMLAPNDPEILAGKCVAILAMGRTGIAAAMRIFVLSHGLKMIGITAAPYPTQMVELQPCRHRPSMNLVGKSMRRAMHFFKGQLSVSPQVHRCGPNPASSFQDTRAVFVDFVEESLKIFHGVLSTTQLQSCTGIS